jgi:acetyl esterase
MALDPQAARILEMTAASDAPALGEGTVAESREAFAKLTEMVGVAAPEPRSLREIRIPGPGGDIRSLVITPNIDHSGPLPLLIYYHGGGWVIGSPETHRREACYYAAAGQCAVLVPDYRLAPEHPFPAAPLDCYAALEWAAAHGAELGADPSRIAVGGDSAGGNLSAVVSQMARDRGGPRIALQLLVYPATRMGSDTASYRDCGDGYFLTATAMNWFFDQYLTKPEDWDDPLASPLLAADFSGLPPALVMTAGFDPLRDEGMEYADRLSAAGVPVEYLCYRNQIHGFVSMAGAIDEGREFLDRAGAALRRAFGT